MHIRKEIEKIPFNKKIVIDRTYKYSALSARLFSFYNKIYLQFKGHINLILFFTVWLVNK